MDEERMVVMKRELKDIKRLNMVNGCCPGHDVFPNETYKNRRSKKARSRGIKKEHRYVRRTKKNEVNIHNFGPRGELIESPSVIQVDGVIYDINND